MQPLLKISSVPIKIEAQTKRATLQVGDSQPARLNIPSLPTTKSASQSAYKPAVTNAAGEAQQNTQPAQETVALNQTSYHHSQAYAADSSGNKNAGTFVGDTSAAVVARTSAPSPAPAPKFVQTRAHTPAPQSAAPPVDYHMDRSTFDWSIAEKPQLEYVPPSIEYSVAQYNELIIEYVGSPIYVPKSADPNYVPPEGES